MATKFNAKEYKEHLKSSSSIGDCGILPNNCGNGDDYIFICYDHRDYKRVYAVLADLCEKGIPFWYDGYFPANVNKNDFSRTILSSPNCRGAIYFTSDNLFAGNSLIPPITGKSTESDQPKAINYISVNLNGDTPTEMLKKALAKKDFSGFENEMEAISRWCNYLSKAFGAEHKTIHISDSEFTESLLQEIRTTFSIEPKTQKEFSAKEYKQRLQNSSDINSCEKIPVTLGNDEDYVLISYSHSDYKQVYADIADLHEEGIPLWYDNGDGEGLGIPPGYTWPEFVQEKINDSHCRGVIFYMSDNLFTSDAIQKEIKIVLERKGNADNRFSYFSVNLTDDNPVNILQRAISTRKFKDTKELTKWTNALNQAFPDDQIYLPFSAPNHKKSLIDNIKRRFDIKHRLKLSRSDDALPEGKYKISKDALTSTDKKVEKNNLSKTTEIQYPNGDIYRGELKGGKRHGKGTYIYSIGAVYTGEFRDGLRHGKGVMKWSNESSYNGEWQNDKRHGKGTYTWADGYVYTGEWFEGKMHGNGKLTCGNYNVGFSRGLSCVFENDKIKPVPSASTKLFKK